MANIESSTTQIEEEFVQIYCICLGKETDEMVFCEGRNCEVEWLHYSCVGLTTASLPDGAWFREACSATWPAPSHGEKEADTMKFVSRKLNHKSAPVTTFNRPSHMHMKSLYAQLKISYKATAWN